VRLPSPLEIINAAIPGLLFVNVVRSLLAGVCFYLAYVLLKNTQAVCGSAPMCEIGSEAE